MPWSEPMWNFPHFFFFWRVPLPIEIFFKKCMDSWYRYGWDIWFDTRILSSFTVSVRNHKLLQTFPKVSRYVSERSTINLNVVSIISFQGHPLIPMFYLHLAYVLHADKLPWSHHDHHYHPCHSCLVHLYQCHHVYGYTSSSSYFKLSMMTKMMCEEGWNWRCVVSMRMKI